VDNLKGMGKKPQNKSPTVAAEHQYRRKPWQLGSDWEPYPQEVPVYEPWAPGQPNTQLQCALDGLRQGELWICMQFEVFAKAVEEDMRARAALLEEHAFKIHTLEGLLRSAGQTHQLLVARDAQLQDHVEELQKQVAELQRQVAELQKHSVRTSCQTNEMMQDVLAMKRDLERQMLDTRGAEFRDQLCDEFVRLATALRAPMSVEQRITAAQISAWRWRVASPALSVASGQHSPAPSVVAFGA